MGKKKKVNRRDWKVDRFGSNIHRPERPAAWLASSAAGALPVLIRRAEQMLEFKKRNRRLWGYEQEARLREALIDIESAKHLKTARFVWVEEINTYGYKEWTIEEDKT